MKTSATCWKRPTRPASSKGHQITDAKRLIEKRREKGPKTGGDRPKLPNSAHSLVKTYQREVARQHKLMLKADQDHQFTPDVTRHLRKMKAARQIEAVELMIAAHTITAAHADALLRPRRPNSAPITSRRSQNSPRAIRWNRS